MCADGSAADDVLPTNHLAVSLLDDATALADRDLLSLLPPAFDQCHVVAQATTSIESPYLLLDSLLARARLGEAERVLSDLADRIMADDQAFDGRGSDEWFWGCTCFDQLHGDWRWHVADALGRSTGRAAVLRDALLGP